MFYYKSRTAGHDRQRIGMRFRRLYCPITDKMACLKDLKCKFHTHIEVIYDTLCQLSPYPKVRLHLSWYSSRRNALVVLF